MTVNSNSVPSSLQYAYGRLQSNFLPVLVEEYLAPDGQESNRARSYGVEDYGETRNAVTANPNVDEAQASKAIAESNRADEIVWVNGSGFLFNAPNPSDAVLRATIKRERKSRAARQSWFSKLFQ